jgi:hypothetical protein
MQVYYAKNTFYEKQVVFNTIFANEPVTFTKKI